MAKPYPRAVAAPPVAMKPQHHEAIRIPGSGIGSDARFADVAALNAAKGCPIEAQWARRSKQSLQGINTAKAAAKTQQAQNSVDGALLGKLLEVHLQGLKIHNHPTLQTQTTQTRLAAYFLAVADECSAIAAQLVQTTD